MTSKSRKLAGRVVFITGGARGIGKATAKALVAAGATVAIGDLDSELAAATAAEIGGGTRGFVLDVADRASFENFVAEAEADIKATPVKDL